MTSWVIASRFLHAGFDSPGPPAIDCEFVHKVKFDGAARGRTTTVDPVNDDLTKWCAVDLRDRQATYNGFGDALATAVEIVVTPLVFALLGWLIDRAAGTGPVFAIALGLFGAAGLAVRMYYRYRDDMDRHEEGKPWTRSRP
jgi:F0F1-type ATP synthase assembly protein I